MNLKKMNLKRIVLLGAIALTMSGCGSTAKNTAVVETPVNSSENAVKVAKNAQSAYQFNKVVEKAIVEGDNKALLAMTDFGLAEANRGLQMHPHTRTMLVEPSMAAAINQKITDSMASLKGYGDVSYRYSDDYGSCCWVSHYQTLGDVMVDVDLYIDKTSKTIFDLSLSPYHYSAAQLIVEVQNQLFELYDSKERGSAFVYNLFVKAVVSYQKGGDRSNVIAAYQKLPDKLKKRVMVAEFLLKAASLVEKQMEGFNIVAKVVAEYHPDQVWLEHYYYENENLDKAIEVLTNSTDDIKGTYVMQGEMLALYKESGDIQSALKEAMNLMYADPNNLYTYIFAVMVSLDGDLHQLTSQILDVIKAKYDFQADADWLKSLGEADNYLASDYFAKWQAAHSTAL